MTEIQFFGDVDKTPTGQISSEWPAWFFDVHVEKMEEAVARKKRQLERGEIPIEHRPIAKNEIAKEEQKIKEIHASKPKLNGGQKDMIAKAYRSIESQLQESMFTERDQKKGFVNPREELQRQSTAYVEVDPKIARACGLGEQKKITGKQAAKCYKIMGKVLGENTNLERIRREGRSESYKSMHELTAKVLEKVSG